MTTRLKEQDTEMRRIGFQVSADENGKAVDFEIPDFTTKEYDSLRKLLLLAKKIWPEDDWFTKIFETSSPYEVMQTYRYNREQLKNLAPQLKPADRIEITEDLFLRLDTRLKYDDFRDFITQDGGEVREGTAFEEDGNTPKPRFIRVYWK